MKKLNKIFVGKMKASNESNLLSKVLNKCYEISTNSKADVFFNYSPHCNIYDIYYYLEGWKENKDFTYISSATKITTKNLKKTLDELKKLQKLTEEKGLRNEVL